MDWLLKVTVIGIRISLLLTQRNASSSWLVVCFLQTCSYSPLVCVTCLKQVWNLPWLRWLVLIQSLTRSGFRPLSVHVGFVVGIIALGQVLFQIFLIPLVLHVNISCICHQCRIILAFDSVIKQNTSFLY
jgi:hypothetical protein